MYSESVSVRFTADMSDLIWTRRCVGRTIRWRQSWVVHGGAKPWHYASLTCLAKEAETGEHLLMFSNWMKTSAPFYYWRFLKLCSQNMWSHIITIVFQRPFLLSIFLMKVIIFIPLAKYICNISLLKCLKSTRPMLYILLWSTYIIQNVSNNVQTHRNPKVYSRQWTFHSVAF